MRLLIVVSKARWQTVSDYISKSALIEDLKNDFCADCTECGGHCRHDDLFETVEKQLTISETEIIRKPFERVVERLEEERKYSYENFKGEERIWRKGLRTAIKIVKEEGGIE